MYNIKEVIKKMKNVLNIDSNIELANYLKVSYNTLNTWIKRGKIPQEVIYDFCQNNSCSFDYLLIDKPKSTLQLKNKDENSDNEIKFKYYAFCDELNIPFGSTLYLSPTLTISNGFYLLKSNNIYTLLRCKIDIFNNKATIYDKNSILTTLDIQEFNSIKVGLLTNFK